MSKNILITGGSGFIGTNLVEYYLNKGFQVLNLDIQQPKIKSHFKFWKNIDVNNLTDLSIQVQNFKPNYIVHLAARTDLDGQNIEDYKTNVEGVSNLLETIQTLKSIKKVLITSSMLVCKSGYAPKTMFDYNPDTIYGESKVLTEKNVWSNTPNCDWSIIRPTSIWGPWFGVPYKNFFDVLMSKRYFHIGNKSCSKTYGFIGNSVYQINQILFSNTLDTSSKVFYLGDYTPINIEEWANEIANELNLKLRRMPFTIVKLLANTGDFLKIFKINFPMTSFRLKNMTTDNIIDLSDTSKLAANLPFNRLQAVKMTLDWILKAK